MLLYFTLWYTTQPRNPPPDNPSSPPSLPKPCHAFSLWPYISCVGQHEELVFRGICISMALLISFSFILLYHLSRPIKEGKWFRRGSTAFALVSSVALVALTYQLIDESPMPHLVTTSGQIFTMFLCKCLDWASNLAIRRAWRRRMGENVRIRPLEVSRWAKIAVAAFTISKNPRSLIYILSFIRPLPLLWISSLSTYLTNMLPGPAIFTSLGIYGCQDASIIADKASTCNRLVAVSEIAEWQLSIGWVAYMCTIAYDLYHVETVVQIWTSTEADYASQGTKHVKMDKERGNNLQILLPNGVLSSSTVATSEIEGIVERIV
jgi:hypothetical protein